MATIDPINIYKWVPNTPILSAEAKQEFLNIYNLVNGQLDAANIKDASLTGSKFPDNSIPGSKVIDFPASKITGKLSTTNLPDGVFTTVGGELTGTLTYNVVDTNTAFIKSYSNASANVIELGTGTNKLQLVINPTGTNLLEFRQNGVAILTITADGTLVPKKFRIPVV